MCQLNLQPHLLLFASAAQFSTFWGTNSAALAFNGEK